MPFRFALVLGVGVIMGFGLSVGRTVQAQREIEPPAAAVSEESDSDADKSVPWQDARLLAEVLEHVRKEYVEKISDQELIEAAIRGMISDLDAHSAFLDPQEFDDIRISTTGEYFGVGIEVALENGVVKVVNPIDGTPAHKAGVLAGDTILAVDGVPVSVDSLTDTIDRMRGKAGTAVKISIARADVKDPMEFTLSRAAVQVHSVRDQMLDGGVGYVRISHFSETTTSDLERSLASLKKKNGAPLSGLVLDLRNNPGGVLEAAVGVSDVFLNDGVIVTANGRTPDARFEMDARPGDALDGAPIVVLVNGNSASASEIVAGALQDHHRATLVGHQTYGKGSVQTVLPLSDGHAIKLTTSKYFTPSGASIHEKGIKPDVVLSDADVPKPKEGVDVTDSYGSKDDVELQLALSTLQQKSIGAIRQSRAP